MPIRSGIRGPKGPKGDKGDTGDMGAAGATGAQGLTGATGEQGVQGLKGDIGNTGATGPQGVQGATGAVGAAGVDGATWRTGSGAPSNGLGVNGDLYLNTATGDVHQRASGSYSIIANIKGAPGIQGVTGNTGAQGIQGTTGAQGPTGSTGMTGATGPSVAIPYVVTLPLIAAVTDIVRIPLTFAGTITRVSFSLQALVSGTITCVTKNDAGSTVASLALSAAGIIETTSPTISSVSAGDHLRVGFSGIGVGAVGATVTFFIQPS